MAWQRLITYQKDTRLLLLRFLKKAGLDLVISVEIQQLYDLITYYLKTNQDGPGKHVCNCGYMVSSGARGRGIARQMCEHSQGTAVTMGFKAMQFNFVASSNDVAVALWKKLGFNVVGTLPRAFNHPTLGLVDAFVMYKWLTD